MTRNNATNHEITTIMATRSDLLIIIGLVFSSFALLFFVIGFSTPHWLELDTNHITESGFDKLGLWEACFDNYAHFRDFAGKVLNGCWWIFSEEYRPIWEYINPPWFLGIQIMMTITLMLEILTVLQCLLFLIKCCKRNVLGLFIVGGFGVISGILTAISVIIFGSKSATETEWIQMPEKNFVSWSFGCVVFSGFLILLAGIVIIVSALHTRLLDKYNKSENYEPRIARNEFNSETEFSYLETENQKSESEFNNYPEKEPYNSRNTKSHNGKSEHVNLRNERQNSDYLEKKDYNSRNSHHNRQDDNLRNERHNTENDFREKENYNSRNSHNRRPEHNEYNSRNERHNSENDYREKENYNSRNSRHNKQEHYEYDNTRNERYNTENDYREKEHRNPRNPRHSRSDYEDKNSRYDRQNSEYDDRHPENERHKRNSHHNSRNTHHSRSDNYEHQNSRNERRYSEKERRNRRNERDDSEHEYRENERSNKRNSYNSRHSDHNSRNARHNSRSSRSRPPDYY